MFYLIVLIVCLCKVEWANLSDKKKWKEVLERIEKMKREVWLLSQGNEQNTIYLGQVIPTLSFSTIISFLFVVP